MEATGTIEKPDVEIIKAQGQFLMKTYDIGPKACVHFGSGKGHIVGDSRFTTLKTSATIGDEHAETALGIVETLARLAGWNGDYPESMAA